MSYILESLEREWAGKVDVREAVVVEQDSGGKFDHAYVLWLLRSQPEVTWRLLRWPGAEPRSLQAFVGLFGQSAVKA